MSHNTKERSSSAVAYLSAVSRPGISGTKRESRRLRREWRWFFAGLLGAGAAAFVPTGAAQAQNIELSSLDGTNGFRLAGVATVDLSGSSVSGAGDVNGDGFADLIVGAKYADPNGSRSGASYVVFGKASGWPASVNLSSLTGTDGFRLAGAATLDQSGISVSGAGDVNGDGFADLIVGAPSAGGRFGRDYGASYVVFGKGAGWPASMNLSSLTGADGFRLACARPGDRSGISVSGAGDVNGDGFADLIVGAPGSTLEYGVNVGASYVVFGKGGGWPASVSLSSLTGTNGFGLAGATTLDRDGFSVSGAGDVNGDGFADLIVGAYNAGPNGNSSGASYVVFGKAAGWPASIYLSSLVGTNGFRLAGAAAYDRSGSSVSGAGDVNGDGFADLIVGAKDGGLNEVYGSRTSYVVFGKGTGWPASVNLSSLTGTDGFRLASAATDDQSGESVSGAGDFNGDGFADLIVGANAADTNGSRSGASYVVFGKETGWDASINLSSLTAADGLRLAGATANDVSGVSVSGAGDVNGDGFGDLIVGAPRADPNGSASGTSYVVFGSGAVGGGGTYQSNTMAGDSTQMPVGTLGDAGQSVPASRVFVDFDGGAAASRETAVVVRSKNSIPSLTPTGDVANVVWQVTTDRTGWTNAAVTFKYLDSEIAAISGLIESNLRIYKADSPEGPWTRLATTVDTAKNQASATIGSFSYFALASPTAVPVSLSGFTLE